MRTSPRGVKVLLRSSRGSTAGAAKVGLRGGDPILQAWIPKKCEPAVGFRRPPGSRGFLPWNLCPPAPRPQRTRGRAGHLGPPGAASPAAGGRRLGSRPGALSSLCKKSGPPGGGLGPAAAESSSSPPFFPSLPCCLRSSGNRIFMSVERPCNVLRTSPAPGFTLKCVRSSPE